MFCSHNIDNYFLQFPTPGGLGLNSTMYPLVNSDAANISTYAERDLLYSLLNQANAGSDPNSDIFNWLQQSVDAISKQQYQPSQAQSAPIPPDIYESLMKATIPSALGIKREHSSLSSSDEVPGFKFNPNVFSLQPTVVDISESEEKSNNDNETPSKKLRAAIEQKEQARAEQQRTASRKYRQKKKQLIEHLEARMKDMEEEKAKIEKERNDTLQVVNKLKEENYKLRKTHAQDSEQVEKDREKLLKELDQLMKGNPSDEEIRPYILRLRDCCQKISVVGECHANLLISPTVVQQLVKNGFFETPFFVGDDNIEPHGIKAFADKVILYVQSLTEDQKQRIKSHVDEFNQRMETVKAEREQLK